MQFKTANYQKHYSAISFKTQWQPAGSESSLKWQTDVRQNCGKLNFNLNSTHQQRALRA
jgi:hypothetical protein